MKKLLGVVGVVGLVGVGMILAGVSMKKEVLNNGKNS